MDDTSLARLPQARQVYTRDKATHIAHTLGVLEGYTQVLHTIRMRIRKLVDANPADLAPRLEELRLHARLYEDQIDRTLGKLASEDPMNDLFGPTPK